MDKVSLNPSNVPTKFRWNNHNTCTFGEKCKNVIADPKNGCEIAFLLFFWTNKPPHNGMNYLGPT